MVYVISKSGKPLMPCTNVIARLLLDSGMARVKRREPFTIKLKYNASNYIQNLTLGVDIGSKTAGFSVANTNNEILYSSEVIVRYDIKRKMDHRRLRRNDRKHIHTRYRKRRFLNRKNSRRKGRIGPTVKSKIDSHKKEIEYIKSILPISEMIFEVGQFNVAALKDPRLFSEKMKHWGYQHGFSCGFENIKAAIRARDHYTCQICNGSHNDHRLEVHHIIPKSMNGSDDPSNLITLCKTCHTNLHNHKVQLNHSGLKRTTLRFATHMNTISSQLIKTYPNATKTWGFVTSLNRKSMGFNEKTHWLDASIIATNGKLPTFKNGIVYIKRCNSKGDYKRTRGQSSSKILPKGKINGFLRYDKVMYEGTLCFIMSRAVKGSVAKLMDIYGNRLFFKYLQYGKKTPKLTRLIRITARSSWMIATQKLKSKILLTNNTNI